MFKIKIYSIGKTKEKWLDDAIAEYVKRLKGTVTLEFLFAKDLNQLLNWLEKEDHMIGLDPNGDMLTSEQFSTYLTQKLHAEGSRLNLVIGGAEGLPENWKQANELISLSKLTFTHQITRLILIEQIYRAIEIDKGSRYHK